MFKDYVAHIKICPLYTMRIRSVYAVASLNPLNICGCHHGTCTPEKLGLSGVSISRGKSDGSSLKHSSKTPESPTFSRCRGGPSQQKRNSGERRSMQNFCCIVFLKSSPPPVISDPATTEDFLCIHCEWISFFFFFFKIAYLE